MMTIRQLCSETHDCSECSFQAICRLNHEIFNVFYHSESANIDMTKAIIETSRKLLEDLE